jgi:exodeoxyribonuclease-5
MPATPHQQEVISNIIFSINSGVKRLVLTGSAGVGKTFVANELVQHFINTKSFKVSKWAPELIYVTAPTNKALSILQGKIPDHPAIAFKTVHSALKLNRIIDDKFDKVYFKPTGTDKNPPFEGCGLAIIDECSMLETALLNLLDDFNFPIIFIGDAQQLNPVGELESPVFKRGYPIFSLTEIIRQGEGNPIIELSRNLDLIKKREPCVTSDGLGYIFSNDRTRIISHLAEANGTDELKYLAWSNMEVDTMNKRVRELLYGSTPNKVELGETLVMDAPKGEHWTNKEVKVEDLKIVTEQVMIPTSFSRFTANGPTNCDKIKMRVYRVNDDFDIVHEHSQKMFETILASIKANCSKFGWSWKAKYFFEEQFAQTKYNHAITVHKSQGSTYKEAVLNVGNINFNKKPEERKRMLYTGITRAAKLLILNNV